MAPVPPVSDHLFSERRGVAHREKGNEIMSIMSKTIRFDIFIAGDIAQAKHVCREYCYDAGLCVTVEPVTYIYTGGEEAGVRIGLINYPRFPNTEAELASNAKSLADLLLHRLSQHSYSIVGPENTEFFSRRKAS